MAKGKRTAERGEELEALEDVGDAEQRIWAEELLGHPLPSGELELERGPGGGPFVGRSLPCVTVAPFVPVPAPPRKRGGRG